MPTGLRPDSHPHIGPVTTGIRGVILTMAHHGTGARIRGITLLQYGGTHGTGTTRGITVHGIGDAPDTTGGIMTRGITTDGTMTLGALRCTTITITTTGTTATSTGAATDGITETGLIPKPPARTTAP